MAATLYQKTSIYPFAHLAGARFEERAGWLEAVTYPGSSAPVAMGLVDQSHYGKVLLQGNTGYRMIEAAGLPMPEEIGRGVRTPGVAIYRLRHDQWFIVTLPGEVELVMTALSAGGEGVSGEVATGLTHGRAMLRLVGAAAAEILARLCPLDFHHAQFPNGAARQTSVARTAQLIIRDDVWIGDGKQATASYCLIGPRSLGAYLWTTLLDAGEDLGLRPIGSGEL